MAGKSFKGNLEILNLSDIFQSLAMNRHSGTLVVNDGKREKKIYFAEGEVTLLSSSRRMKLGELLISAGKITEEDLDLALKLQKQSRKKLGEILVEEGFCTDDDIFKLVRMQIEEEIYDLFLWRKADFEFIADQIPEDMAREAPNLTRLALNTNSLIMEAIRRLDEWNLMRDLVPTTKEVFVVADAEALAGAKAIERFRPELVDGKTTVEGLAEKMLLSEFDLCKQLAELVRDGALRPLRQEELAEKAEEAYAVNDFSAAAALYGRLAEHIPDQPKILIPLADSLRRTGADKQALVIYDDLTKQLERSGQEPERLRQCLEAITQLDPARQDAARKLEELDLARAASPRRSLVLPLAGLLVLALAGVVAFTQRERLAALLQKPPPPPTARKSAEILEDMTRARASKQYEAWFAKAVELWEQHPQSPEFRKIDLPILVTTRPAGYEVYVNEVFQGVTEPGAEFLVCTFGPATGVHVEVKPPKREGREHVALWQVDVEPKKFQHLRVPVFDAPDGTFIPDGWLDAGLAWAEAAGGWVGPTRDGKLRAVKLEGRSLVPLDGLDGQALGEFGDAFSAPVVHGGRVLVGGVEGGVTAVELAPTDKASPVRRGLYPVGGPVVAAPVVAGEGADARVVVASVQGEVAAFALDGGAPRWTARSEGRVAHPLRWLKGPRLVVVAGEDAQVLGLRLDDGAVAWSYAADAPLDGPPHVVGDDVVLVTLGGGRLVALDGRTGAPRGEGYADAEKRRLVVTVSADGKRAVVASHDGAVRALDARTLEPVWDAPAACPTRVPPLVAVFRDRVVVAVDPPDMAPQVVVLGLSLKDGRLLWQAKFDEGAGRACSLSSFADRFFVATTRNYVHVFDAEDH